MKTFIGFLGLAFLAFGNIGGIGYFLYLWGGAEVAIGLAAWTAFKLWFILVVSGFIMFVGALFSTSTK